MKQTSILIALALATTLLSACAQFDSKRGVVNESSDLVVAINDLQYERSHCRKQNLHCDVEIFEVVDGEWLRADREEASGEYAETLVKVKAMIA